MAQAKKSFRFVLAAVFLAVAAYAVYWWIAGRFLVATDNAYVRADISTITPRVAGEVLAVAVRENEDVQRGDVLVQIDARDYQARVDNARAALAAAQAALAANGDQLKLQGSLIAQAQATLDAAHADQSRLESEWKRADRLVREGVSTRQRMDTALAAYKSGAANVAKAQAALQAAQQQVAALDAEGQRLHGQLDAQKALLDLAQIDLDSTMVRAPIAGTVGDLAARVGERVTPGERLLSLVPLQAVYVEANYKETQLPGMAIGQAASLKVDAFPGATVRGHVDSLSPASGAEFALLPPQNATGNFTKIVQRVPVRIALEADEPLRGRLRPGMSVVATVDTRTTPPAEAKAADAGMH